MTPNADDHAAYPHAPSSPDPAACPAAEAETAAQETRRFAELVLPLQPALYARALGLARSSADAGDLVQDTLERALRSFQSFQRGTNMKLWLFRIMHNLFVDRCRRRAREPWRKPSTVGPLAMGSVAGPDPDTGHGWDAAEELDLHEAVAKLTPPLRSVLHMHVTERRSYRDIGARLGIPVNTVGTRLVRAREKMKLLMLAARKARAQGKVPAPRLTASSASS